MPRLAARLFTELTRIECIREGDRGSGLEFYAGQKVSVEGTDIGSDLIFTTFTEKCELESGFKLKAGEFEEDLGDMQAMIPLTPLTTTETSRLVTFRFYGFENDDRDDAIQIKKAFSNQFNSFLTEMPQQEDTNFAKTSIKTFLKNDIKTFGISSAFQPISSTISGVVDGVLSDLLGDNGDDLISMNTFLLKYKTDNQGKLEYYQFDFEGDGFGEKFTTEQTFLHQFELKSHFQDHIMNCTLKLRVVPE